MPFITSYFLIRNKVFAQFSFTFLCFILSMDRQVMQEGKSFKPCFTGRTFRSHTCWRIECVLITRWQCSNIRKRDKHMGCLQSDRHGIGVVHQSSSITFWADILNFILGFSKSGKTKVIMTMSFSQT